MNFPKQKEEILSIVKQYHNWHDSGGEVELYPKEIAELDKEHNFIKLIFGSLFHFLLFVGSDLFKALKIWSLVALFSKLRIATDKWSLEPRQCGYNRAYTYIGIFRLRRNDIPGAVTALKESWQVYPCPHNTSFGLLSSLAKELKKYPEVQKEVEEYREIYNAFKAV